MSVCGVPLGVCAVRVTKLDALGNVVAGSNAYVTDKQLSVAVNPNIETGTQVLTRNGCGCSLARYKYPDILNWYDLVLTDLSEEPDLQALLLGATVITDAGSHVGIHRPGALACNVTQPMVGFEFWVKNVVGSSQDTTFPWYHFVFPASIWQEGNTTFDENAAQVVLNGFTRTNPQWGHGPYGDGPPDGSHVANDGSWWETDVDPPTAACATQSVTATS